MRRSGIERSLLSGLAGLILSLVPSAAPVRADQSWAPAWKVLAGDGSLHSSTCIGSNASLDCLVDTVVACSAWSEDPEWRADGLPFDHPICDSARGFDGVSAVLVSAPAATQHFLYATDVWTLQNARDWPTDTEGLARQGDQVVDLFSITCAPRTACLARLDPLTPPREILAACPRDYCYGSSRVLTHVDVTMPGADADVFVDPGFSLLTRETDQGWVVIDWYYLSRFGLRDPGWYPDHWKRK